MKEDKMVGWHHRLNGHEFEQAPGDVEGQGSLVCCSPWGHKESEMPEQLNNNSKSDLVEKGQSLTNSAGTIGCPDVKVNMSLDPYPISY